MDEVTLLMMVIAGAITLLAGFVKGAVGFGLPMIMISGLATFLPVEIALAGLILPTLISNIWQAMRYGWAAMLASAKRFRIYVIITMVFVISSAQLIRFIPQDILFLFIGAPVVLFSLLQLLGIRFHIAQAHRNRVEIVVASIAGFIGGLSGVWGPPFVAYLTAIDTPKQEQIRTLGVVFLLGTVALTLGHLKSGVLNAATIPFSAMLVIPTLVGMGLGLMVHDRMPQSGFRRVTLIVLTLAGANLIRRGIMA